MLLAVTDVSRYTRLTEEIFSALISCIFIFGAHMKVYSGFVDLSFKAALFDAWPDERTNEPIETPTAPQRNAMKRPATRTSFHVKFGTLQPGLSAMQRFERALRTDITPTPQTLLAWATSTPYGTRNCRGERNKSLEARGATYRPGKDLRFSRETCLAHCPVDMTPLLTS